MSKPNPQTWRRESDYSLSPTLGVDDITPGAETPLAHSDSEDRMAYLRSMSYVHMSSSGRFGTYSSVDSRRSSTLNGGTLVANSPTPTDYASSEDISGKNNKKHSPLRDSNSWDGQDGGFGALSNASTMIRKMKYGRLRYIDGLRLLAAIIALTSTVIATTSTKWAVGSSILHPFNSNFGLVLFLAISGRTLGLPWLLSRKDALKTAKDTAAKAKAAKAAKTAPAPKKLSDEPSSGKSTPTTLVEKPGTPSSTRSVTDEINAPDFELFGMAMLARPFRFLLPILFVTGIQYGVCEATGLYPSNANFETLIGTRPGWCFPDASQWIVAATNLFVTEDRPTQLQNETGALFFLPWLFQNSYYLYGLTMIVTILQKDTRVSFLALLAFLSWTTLSYIAPAILGLMVAELDVSGQIRKVRKGNKLISLGLQALIAVVFLLLLLVPQIRNPIDTGLSAIQVLRPSSQNDANIYGVIRFSDVICSTLLLLFIEFSQLSQKVLSFAPISMMGQQIAAAIVAIHGIVLWSIMPRVFPMASDTSATSGAASNLVGIWALTLLITLALSIFFRLVIEIPSEILGRAALIFFYGQDKMQQLSNISLHHVERAKNSGYLLPIPSLGNPMAKLGLTKIPWSA
ncbi:hypothetical protein BCV70DRAFT_113205 [Testicularia cyperi]|uniref:Uncharacterized protein n=1 Tax=Testicularia cyperi TaxID=1882483 RepID=A0A317XNZ7_9BASI|nr:hypothetical protein BCV70DRAFT_113205 [Testicularia cyperi]